MLRRRRAARRPGDHAAAGWARELGIELVAGSFAERVEGREMLSNTSLLIDPEGEIAATYRKIHMFDVEVGGVAYRESETRAPGRRDRDRPTAGGRARRADRLLRPPLPRALPDPRRQRRAS